MGTTVWVDDETRERLRELQRQMGTDSVNATIKRLMDHPPLTAQALFVRYHDEIQEILDRHGLYALVAFGSRARGDARPDSDLDLAVRARPEASALSILSAEADLEDLLHIPVHIVELPNPRLSTAIQEEGIAFEG